MKTVSRWVRTLRAAIGLALIVPSARAAYIINVNQVGSDVVATGGGSFDVTDLAPQGNASATTDIDSDDASLLLGPPGSSPISYYTGFTGPTSFGTNNSFFPSTGSGPIAGIFGFSGDLVAPANYVSGTLLATTTDTWTSQTFATLGLTPGTYEWTWGTDGDADSLTVQIGPASSGVPLPPAAWAGLLTTAVAFAFRRKLVRAA